MIDAKDYHQGGGKYEFPDGTVVKGKEEAEKYAAEVNELENVAEEEAQAEAEAAADDDSDEVADVPETDGAEDLAVESDEGKTFLVKMNRPNMLFEFVGKSRTYQFKRDARILPVDEVDVSPLMEQGGFEMVTVEQTKEYYS